MRVHQNDFPAKDESWSLVFQYEAKKINNVIEIMREQHNSEVGKLRK